MSLPNDADESSSSNPGDSDDAASAFHVQPSSLSKGYETPAGSFSSKVAEGVSSFDIRRLDFLEPHAEVPTQCNMMNTQLQETPYQASELKTKMKTMRFRLTECKKWLEFKKPLDERRLCQAVSMNDTATVAHLLNQGVSASCYDSQRRSPLHLASCKGYAHIVKTLLEHGADPNARDSIGNTPLHLAACTNHINVVMLLLNAGTNACSIDKLGRSPLQLAQSKLKILQRSHVPDEDIKAQVTQVIEMLLHFSSQGEDILDPELLSKFQTNVRLSDTREQVDSQLRDLLDNLGSLSLKS